MPESAIPPRGAGTTATAPPRTTTPPPPKTDLNARAKVVKQGVVGLVIPPLAGMAMVQERRNPGQISPFALDVATIAMHVDTVAVSIAKLAETNPALAAGLDKLAMVTPFGELLGGLLVIGAQIAENHGRFPPAMEGAIPTVIPRQEFAQSLKEQGEAIKNAANNGA